VTFVPTGPAQPPRTVGTVPEREVVRGPAPVPSRLSAADSLMWRIDSDPVLRSPILVVGLLDRSPTPDRLAATIERAAAFLPRLRQRIECLEGALAEVITLGRRTHAVTGAAGSRRSA
jgi:hypothetical protein